MKGWLAKSKYNLDISDWNRGPQMHVSKGRSGVITLQNALVVADSREVLGVQKLGKTMLAIFMYLFIDFEGWLVFFSFFFFFPFANRHSVHGTVKHTINSFCGY